MNRRFPVPAPGKLTLMFLLGVGLLVPVGVLIGILSKGSAPPPAAMLVATAVVGLVVALTVATLKRRSVAIEDGDLVVRCGIHTRRVPIAQLDTAGARILSLEEHREDRPFWRINGVRMPGYRAGNFYTRGRTRLFCLLTDYRRVLRLQESSGRLLLISLERPRELLEALQEHSALP